MSNPNPSPNPKASGASLSKRYDMTAASTQGGEDQIAVDVHSTGMDHETVIDTHVLRTMNTYSPISTVRHYPAVRTINRHTASRQGQGLAS